MDTAVFIGLCERGPLAAPVVIESWEGFLQVFGRPGLGRQLPDCVRLFFDNGGRRCIILRALHGDAKAARWELPDWLTAGGARVGLYARSPGAWGNGIRGALTLSSRHAGVEPAIEPPLPPPPWNGSRLRGRGLTALDPTRGSILRFEAPIPDNAVCRTVVSVRSDEDGTSILELDSPLPIEYRAFETVARAREVLLDLDLETAGYAERFVGLGLNSAHPRFLPRMLAYPSPHEGLADYDEARTRNWPVGDTDAAYVEEEPEAGRQREQLPTGSALVAPDKSLLSLALAVVEGLADEKSIPLDRRTPLPAVPEREGDDAGATFEREHFALGRESLARHEEKFRFEPGALYCLPDLMHPIGIASKQYSEITPASPTRFGTCGPAAPDSDFSDAVDYPLLSAAGGIKNVLAVQQNWLEWLSIRREEGWPAIALFDVPPDSDAQGILEFRRGLAADYAALYAPWFHAAAPALEGGGLRLLPPSTLAAAMAAVAERETGPHGAPAHRDTRGLVSLYENGRLPESGFLHQERINALRQTEIGIRLLGSRTTSFDPQWTHINVRRLVDWLKRQLALDSRWAVFEPNHDALRTRIRQTAERRLRLLFERGAFSGRTQQESYFVRARAERADFGELIVEVGVAPSVPMEFIVFELVPPAPEGSPLEDSLA